MATNTSLFNHRGRFEGLQRSDTSMNKRIQQTQELSTFIEKVSQQKDALKVSLTLEYGVESLNACYHLQLSSPPALRKHLAKLIVAIGMLRPRSYVEWTFQVAMGVVGGSNARAKMLDMMIECFEAIRKLKQDSNDPSADIIGHGVTLDVASHHCRFILESTHEPDIVVAVARVISYINTLSPEKLQPHFVKIVPLLLGWCTDSQLADDKKNAILQTIEDFDSLWKDNSAFCFGLASTMTNDINEICYRIDNLEPHFVRKLHTLIRCFVSITESVSSIVLSRDTGNPCMLSAVLNSLLQAGHIIPAELMMKITGMFELIIDADSVETIHLVADVCKLVLSQCSVYCADKIAPLLLRINHLLDRFRGRVSVATVKDILSHQDPRGRRTFFILQGLNSSSICSALHRLHCCLFKSSNEYFLLLEWVSSEAQWCFSCKRSPVSAQCISKSVTSYLAMIFYSMYSCLSGSKGSFKVDKRSIAGLTNLCRIIVEYLWIITCPRLLFVISKCVFAYFKVIWKCQAYQNGLDHLVDVTLLLLVGIRKMDLSHELLDIYVQAIETLFLPANSVDGTPANSFMKCAKSMKPLERIVSDLLSLSYSPRSLYRLRSLKVLGQMARYARLRDSTRFQIITLALVYLTDESELVRDQARAILTETAVASALLNPSRNQVLECLQDVEGFQGDVNGVGPIVSLRALGFSRGPAFWRKQIASGGLMFDSVQSKKQMQGVLDWLVHPHRPWMDWMAEGLFSMDVVPVVSTKPMGPTRAHPLSLMSQFNPLFAAFALVRDTGKMCAEMKLRTHFGGAAQTFGRLEDVLKEYLVCPESATSRVRCRLLLKFMESIEEQIDLSCDTISASTVCSVPKDANATSQHSFFSPHDNKHFFQYADFPVVELAGVLPLHIDLPSSASVAFFSANKRVCEDWLTRIRGFLIRLSIKCESHPYTIQHSMKRAVDVQRAMSRLVSSNLSTSNEVISLTSVRDLHYLRRDLDSTLFHLCTALCATRQTDALKGFYSWSTHLMQACARMPGYSAHFSGSGAEQNAQIPWMLGMLYESQGRYEDALQEYFAMFQSLLTQADVVDRLQEAGFSMDSLQGIKHRGVLCCVALLDWKALDDWLNLVDTVRHRALTHWKDTKVTSTDSWVSVALETSQERNTSSVLRDFDSGALDVAITKLSETRRESIAANSMEALLHMYSDVTGSHLERAQLLFSSMQDILVGVTLESDNPSNWNSSLVQLQCMNAILTGKKESACLPLDILNEEKIAFMSLDPHKFEVGMLNRLHFVQNLQQHNLKNAGDVALDAVLSDIRWCTIRLARKQGNYRLCDRILASLDEKTKFFKENLSLQARFQYEHAQVLHSRGKAIDAIIQLSSLMATLVDVKGYLSNPSDASTLHFDKVDLPTQMLALKILYRIAQWVERDDGVMSKEIVQSNEVLENLRFPIEVAFSSSLGPRESVAGGSLLLGTKLSSSSPEVWIKYSHWCYAQAEKTFSDMTVAEGSTEALGWLETEVEELRSISLDAAAETHSKGGNHDEIFQLLQLEFGTLTDLLQERVDQFEARIRNKLLCLTDDCVTRLVQLQQKIRHRLLHFHRLAVHAYFKYLSLVAGSNSNSETGHLFGSHDVDSQVESQTMITLRLLRLLLKFGFDLKDEFNAGFQSAAMLQWIGIVPQLRSRMGHPDPFVRESIKNLMLQLSSSFPHSLVYTAVIGSNDESFDMSDEWSIKSIKKNLEARFPLLVENVSHFVNELNRIAILWDEKWMTALTGILKDISRRLKILNVEYRRIMERDDVQLSERQERKQKTYTLVLKPVVLMLEKLWRETCGKPTVETDYEKGFVAKFGSKIRVAIDKVSLESNVNDLFSVSTPLTAILKALQHSLGRQAKVQLQSISPTLTHVLKGDAVISIPGGYERRKRNDFGQEGESCDLHRVLVQGMASDVVILRTKTRPKRLEFIGSDGNSYMYLLKFSEDLHLDERIMQVIDNVNQLMSMDKYAEARHLHAGHYSVIPISRKAGLIQMVPDVSALFNVYKEWQVAKISSTPPSSTTEKNDSSSSVSSLFASLSVSMNHPTTEKTAEFSSAHPAAPSPSAVFWAKLLPLMKAEGFDCNAHPRSDWPLSVLKKAFKELQADVPRYLLSNRLRRSSCGPMEWFSKVGAYSRTLAVSSVIGYVIGLGDRHLDNILMSMETGEILHIDYNICFDKGRTLKVPEIVPFRLTSMLVAALGPTGTEGRFRIAFEHTLRILRRNKEILMTLLEAFVYDPLLDWTHRTTTDEVIRLKVEMQIGLCMFASQANDLLRDWVEEEAEVLESASAFLETLCVLSMHHKTLGHVEMKYRSASSIYLQMQEQMRAANEKSMNCESALEEGRNDSVALENKVKQVAESILTFSKDCALAHAQGLSVIHEVCNGNELNDILLSSLPRLDGFPSFHSFYANVRRDYNDRILQSGKHDALPCSSSFLGSLEIKCSMLDEKIQRYHECLKRIVEKGGDTFNELKQRFLSLGHHKPPQSVYLLWKEASEKLLLESNSPAESIKYAELIEFQNQPQSLESRASYIGISMHVLSQRLFELKKQQEYWMTSQAQLLQTSDIPHGGSSMLSVAEQCWKDFKDFITGLSLSNSQLTRVLKLGVCKGLLERCNHLESILAKSDSMQVLEAYQDVCVLAGWGDMICSFTKGLFMRLEVSSFTDVASMKATGCLGTPFRISSKIQRWRKDLLVQGVPGLLDGLFIATARSWSSQDDAKWTKLEVPHIDIDKAIAAVQEVCKASACYLEPEAFSESTLKNDETMPSHALLSVLSAWEKMLNILSFDAERFGAFTLVGVDIQDTIKMMGGGPAVVDQWLVKLFAAFSKILDIGLLYHSNLHLDSSQNSTTRSSTVSIECMNVFESFLQEWISSHAVSHLKNCILEEIDLVGGERCSKDMSISQKLECSFEHALPSLSRRCSDELSLDTISLSLQRSVDAFLPIWRQSTQRNYIRSVADDIASLIQQYDDTLQYNMWTHDGCMRNKVESQEEILRSSKSIILSELQFTMKNIHEFHLMHVDVRENLSAIKSDCLELACQASYIQPVENLLSLLMTVSSSIQRLQLLLERIDRQLASGSNLNGYNDLVNNVNAHGRKLFSEYMKSLQAVEENRRDQRGVLDIHSRSIESSNVFLAEMKAHAQEILEHKAMMTKILESVASCCTSFCSKSLAFSSVLMGLFPSNHSEDFIDNSLLSQVFSFCDALVKGTKAIAEKRLHLQYSEFEEMHRIHQLAKEILTRYSSLRERSTRILESCHRLHPTLELPKETLVEVDVNAQAESDSAFDVSLIDMFPADTYSNCNARQLEDVLHVLRLLNKNNDFCGVEKAFVADLNDLVDQFKELLRRVEKFNVVDAPIEDDGKLDAKEPASCPTPLVQKQERNAHAVNILRRIKDRLDGRTMHNSTKESLGSKMSIGEQTDWLIKQATSSENLCRMFEGWTPWI